MGQAYKGYEEIICKACCPVDKGMGSNRQGNQGQTATWCWSSFSGLFNTMCEVQQQVLYSCCVVSFGHWQSFQCCSPVHFAWSGLQLLCLCTELLPPASELDDQWQLLKCVTALGAIIAFVPGMHTHSDFCLGELC